MENRGGCPSRYQGRETWVHRANWRGPAPSPAMLRAELEELDPPVARVGDIEAIGGVDPQTPRSGEFTHFSSELAERGERMAVGAINANQGKVGQADVDVALLVRSQPVAPAGP